MTTPAEVEERVLATAQQIVKNLGTSSNMKEDMMFILSNFDNRFSNITDLFSSSGGNRIDVRLDAAEKVISQWGCSSSSVSSARDFIPWDDFPDVAAEYLASVDEVIGIIEEVEGIQGDGVDADVLDRADKVLQMAMDRLEDEFRHILVQNTVSLDAERLFGSLRMMSLSFASDGGEIVEDLATSEEELDSSLEDRSNGGSLSNLLDVELIRVESIPHLRSIADRMIQSKYERECCQAYSVVRRAVLDECLITLGIERMSIEEVQRMEWKSLDEKMKKWVHAVKAVVQGLLYGERKLCDQIFEASPLLADACFSETTKGCIMQLLNFAEAVAIGQRSSEKLFRILDMYDALFTVIPDLETKFSEETKEFLCSEAEITLKRLGDAAKGTLAEFESAVQRETSVKQMQFGDIHPLTRYVMNYMKLLVDYSGTLNALISENEESGEIPDGDQEDHLNRGPLSPLGQHILSTISKLESNIEEKSKLYEDTGIQYIFLTNNLHYMVQRVKDSDLRGLLGDEWVRRHRGQIRQYARSYLRASWTKVIQCLKDEGTGYHGSSGSASKLALKERFKNFNFAFEENCRMQMGWKVPDSQLREELRISISEMVIPAYRSFMGRPGNQLEGGRHAAKYMKYTPEDLERHFSDLFEGSSGFSSLSRRKLSS